MELDSTRSSICLEVRRSISKAESDHFVLEDLMEDGREKHRG